MGKHTEISDYDLISPSFLDYDIGLTVVPLPTVILGPQGGQLIADLRDGSTIGRSGDHLGRGDRSGGDKESDNAAEHRELLKYVVCGSVAVVAGDLS